MKSVAEPTRTRGRVVSLLFELGPCTAVTLSERLGLTSAAIRRHLDALRAEGTVSTREAQHPTVTRGRPARLYALTDAGHAAGRTAYDDLAISALRFMTPEQVEAFAQARGAELEARCASVAIAANKPAALADALSADGYAASVSEQGLGVQLCQHHCPVQHVAEEFPQLCEAETTALGRLLGVQVRRLGTIAHGDGLCTTHVPLAQSRSIPAGKPTR